MDSTLNFINSYHQEIMLEIIIYQAEAYPFRNDIFKEQSVKLNLQLGGYHKKKYFFRNAITSNKIIYC
jgi:hypothetical protein